MSIHETLREALGKEIREHDLSGHNISVRCKALSATEAIGRPDHDDYPIMKGKEIMVEAVFEETKGQAFSDEFENADYLVEDLLKIELNSNKRRASFISGLNAVFGHLGLCDKTVHCKDAEPKECADNLSEIIESRGKVLLVGYQPRFLETLASKYHVRVVDLDQDNIGKTVLGVAIEPPEMTPDAVRWCDSILATGSTVVNGTIAGFMNLDKPVVFYGVTISATARILGLQTYCHCGH